MFTVAGATAAHAGPEPVSRAAPDHWTGTWEAAASGTDTALPDHLHFNDAGMRALADSIDSADLADLAKGLAG